MLDQPSVVIFRIAERICTTVAQRSTEIPQAGIRVTVSVGVASVDAGELLALSAIVNRADQALYRAKQLGRNRVVHWAQELDVS